ncbi:MAG: hypothetical protein QOK19_53, partial [Solirubrobacteraceae bacterium]|nr:hypothetical protein [Solirubrobacteraceae bacterium]
MRPGRWNYGLLLAGAMLLLGVLAGPVASA